MAIDDEFKQRRTSRGYIWLKLFTTLLDEPEYMQLSDTAKAVYLEVYILAGRSDSAGLILVSDKPATVDKLAWLLRRHTNELQSAIDELAHAGLIDTQGGQVTVCRFASEQGPSMDEKRAEWRMYQRTSRARAKGEKLPDEPETDEKSEPGKIEKSEGVKELNKTENSKPEVVADYNKNKNKRVSSMSGQSQSGVSTDSGSSSLLNEYADTILTIWQVKTGKKYPKNAAFLKMCQYWFDERVTIGHVTESINLVQTYAEPNTPMYLRDVVINLKNTGPQNALDTWRELWDKSHSEGE